MCDSFFLSCDSELPLYRLAVGGAAPLAGSHRPLLHAFCNRTSIQDRACSVYSCVALVIAPWLSNSILVCPASNAIDIPSISASITVACIPRYWASSVVAAAAASFNRLPSEYSCVSGSDSSYSVAFISNLCDIGTASSIHCHSMLLPSYVSCRIFAHSHDQCR